MGETVGSFSTFSTQQVTHTSGHQHATNISNIEKSDSGMAVFRKRASVSLTHSLSMFQPSLTSHHNNSNTSLNQYKPPLFTSSCNSIEEETKNTEEKSGKSRSQRQSTRR